MNSRAEALVGHSVTPVPGAKRQVYALAIGEIIKRHGMRMTDKASHREQVVSLDTFRLEIEGNLHIFSIPCIEEFIKNTKMKCLEVLDEDTVIIEAIINFREAAFGSKKRYVLPMEMKWEAAAFTGAESYVLIEGKSPAVQSRIDKYFS